MKAILKLILCSMMSLSIVLPAMAMEEESSFSTLTPSLLFTFDNFFTPKTNIGQTLKNAGFTQTSVKENKKGYIVYGMYDGLNHDKYYSTFVKTFTKGGLSIKYKYAINNSGKIIDFEFVHITFPSKAEMDTFISKLKTNVQKLGLKAFLAENNYYVIGEDDDDLNNNSLWAYSSGYAIDGYTLEVWFSCGCMNPHEGFIDN